MQDWIGMTVAHVLGLCGTPYAEVRMVDEPPGKLRAVEFDCHQDHRRVVLELQYTPALFSTERSWGAGLVGQQKVVGVREPGSGGY